MAKIDQQFLEDFILDHSPTTYPDLLVAFGADGTMAMQIDRTLQKLRRKGKIELKREGPKSIWSAVKAAPEGVE